MEAASKEQLLSLAKAVRAGDTAHAQSLFSQISLPTARSHQTVAIANILAVAVHFKHPEMVSALLSFRPELADSMFAWKAIDLAADAGDTQTLQHFVDGGWKIDEQNDDSNQRPLLKVAVVRNNAQLRKWLLEHGASPTAQDRYGVSAKEWAAQVLGAAELTEFLDHHSRLRRGKEAKNPSPPEDDDDEDDSLHFAAIKGRVDNAEILLSRGADVSKPEKDAPTPGEPRRRGRTPLRIAVEEAQPRMVAWLLQHGARPDEVDRYGMSVLDMAVHVTRASRDDTIERMLKDYRPPPTTTSSAAAVGP